jgi:hypothetical protein
MIFPCSVLAHVTINNELKFAHTALNIEANNHYEAVGIAQKLSKKLYPEGTISIQVNENNTTVTKENIDKITITGD